MSPKTFPCRQWGPNSVAFFTPLHFVAGAGAFQRKPPTGGAAYGMPRKVFTLPSSLPSTVPKRVFTCGADDPANENEEIASAIEQATALREICWRIVLAPECDVRTSDCKGKREWLPSQISNLPSTIGNHEWNSSAECLYPSATQGRAALASGRSH